MANSEKQGNMEKQICSDWNVFFHYYYFSALHDSLFFVFIHGELQAANGICLTANSLEALK